MPKHKNESVGGTRPVRKIVRVDRSPMNAKVWCVELECGHEVWVYRKPRSTPKGLECEKCPRSL